ncbi:uncharacterized protein V1516DRAFT_570953 [Lipomyces oligophaga]|uniref:uncharacterized protein n=1 Tax=Lipomyces oligophaga TaxID=45792 RepID=UPI0034CD876C
MTDEIADVATKLESTNLADKPIAEAQHATEDPASLAPMIKEDPIEITEKRRIYLGNIPYSVTVEEVASLIGTSHKPSSIILPPHHFNAKQNAGYGFIDFVSSEEALGVIEELQGKNLGERQVHAQLARPPSTRPPRSRPLRKSGRSGRSNSARQRKAASKFGSDGATSTEADGSSLLSDSPTEIKSADDKGVQAPPAGSSSAVESAPAGDENKSPSKQGKPSRPRQKRSAKEGTPSMTTVFASNLNYSCTEEKLAEFFAEYNPESIQIFKRYIPPKVLARYAAKGINRRLQLFALAKFANEEVQKKVIEELNRKECVGRQLFLRVAIDSPPGSKSSEDVPNSECAQVNDTEGTDCVKEAAEPERNTPETGAVENPLPAVEATA